ncbi:MAG: helix-turn-helix transcriptional regulator [Nitrosomonadaceae bacterium]|nr:helix-turn-helix transcriptional regulator [Alphaproteobacteria bacterium]MCK5435508.1 helix-turn-helix transcriptional regulator [Nitrosomonadaceae bacterium]
MNTSDPCSLFGDKLRALRNKKNLSQEELAHLADLDRTYISSIERGKRNISLRNIFKIARALNVAPKQLIDFGGGV